MGDKDVDPTEERPQQELTSGIALLSIYCNFHKTSEYLLFQLKMSFGNRKVPTEKNEQM